MLRTFLLISLLALAGLDPAQAQHAAVRQPDYPSKDTDHIVDTYSPFGSVYILNNRSSALYDSVRKWSFFVPFLITDHDPQNGTFDYCPYCHSSDLKAQDLQHLAQNWYEMKYYNGRYYTYLSDPNEVRQFQLTPYVAREYYMDGPVDFRIDSLQKINARYYHLSLLSCDGGHRFTLNIYMIDTAGQVAVFEFPGRDNWRYRLLVSADHIRDFPAIVNLSSFVRSAEFPGDDDKIPFRKMIENVLESRK